MAFGWKTIKNRKRLRSSVLRVKVSNELSGYDFKNVMTIGNKYINKYVMAHFFSLDSKARYDNSQ